MKIKLNSILIPAMVTLMAFFAVAYSGCKKTDNSDSVNLCASMTCENGGVCFKGECTCAEGYEGQFCEIAWLSRYEGRWNVTEDIVGSSNDTLRGVTREYVWTINGKEGNAATFVISNFMQQEGNTAECRIGRNAKYEVSASTRFVFERNQITGGKQMMEGAGSVNSSGTYITGSYLLEYPTDTGAGKDTVTFTAAYVP